MASMADGRILIADDEDGLRWVLEKGFRGAGYQVTAVKDGTAALRESEAQPFDLILLDIRMPGLDGNEVARRLRLAEARCSRAPLKLVALTANAFAEDQATSRAAGFDMFLVKPMRRDDLQRLLPAQGSEASKVA